MGLDQYLTEKRFIGAKYEHRKITGSIDIKEDGESIDIPLNQVSEIILELAYWRKANQINKWMFDNSESIQQESIECEIQGKQLIELSKLCKKVIDKLGTETETITIKSKYSDKNEDFKVYKNRKYAEEYLPTEPGFFYGSQIIDEYYKQDLEDTIEQLKDVHPDIWYNYYASW